MEFLEDPGEMTPEERLAEVAAILAAGWQRRSRSAVPFTEKPLDCSAAPIPLCVNGLTQRDPAEDAA